MSKQEMKQTVKSLVDQWYEARKEAGAKAQFEVELEAYVAQKETEAVEKGWFEGFEAGQATGSNKMKGISYEEGKQAIFKARPDIKEAYDSLKTQQEKTE